MKKRLTLVLLGMVAICDAASKPNVIYIIADDLGYGDLSSYGQTKFSTPNIDAIGKNGMTFKNHYSSAPICAPARGALMTGMHVGHGAVRGNSEFQPEGQQAMPGDTFTMAHLFKTAGYATGAFGKWGLGFPGSASEPLKMGFDRFYGFNCQRLAHHYYPYFLWNDDQRDMLWGNFGMETEQYAPDLIQEQALKFVEANKDRPFFLFYPLIQPHAEMIAPEKTMAKYRGKFPPEVPYEGVDSGPDFRKYEVSMDPNSPLELYDLSKDPGEKNNVAEGNPDIVRRLDRLITGARTVSPIENFNFPKNTSVKQPARSR